MPVYIWFSVVAGLGIGFAFMNIPPVAGQFMGLFGVGYAGLSLFLSGLLWSHSLSQIPVGLLADKKSPVFLLGVAMFGGVALNLLPFVAPGNLALATFLRFLLGLCTGVAFLAVLKVLGLLTPPEEMQKAQGYFGGAYGFGTMLPYFILPYTGERGWAFSYLLTAAFFLAGFVAVLLLPRHSLRHGFSRQETAAFNRNIDIPALLRRVVRAPDIWMLGLLHGTLYGALLNLGQWLPSILADLSGEAAAGWALATMLVLFIGSCGRWFSGHAAKVVPRRLLIAGSLFLVFVLFCALGGATGPKFALVAGLLMAVPCGLCHGALFTMAVRALPPVFMGTAMGLMNSVANLVNVGLTLMFGNMRETTGSFSRPLFLAGAFSVLLVLVFYRRLERLDERVD